ncbi:triose-phosphate isomerase [Candidatus Roizmanbacteria bacterium]|nr:triose-phosphate isomerase [Candidatus Roizmanbacteria bacterium]
MIFVNFKTYQESSAQNSLTLASICYEIAQQTQISISPVIQAFDLAPITGGTKLHPWLQHVDPFEPGAKTGYLTLDAARAWGAAGTILNHSEHTLPFDVLVKTVERIRTVDQSFPFLICVPDLKTLEKVKMLQPNYIAYEPPELIGSTTGSVATEQSDVIAAAVDAAEEIPLIVGAGIKSAEDVIISLEKGARGILVASAVVKAENQKEKLLELAQAFTAS